MTPQVVWKWNDKNLKLVEFWNQGNRNESVYQDISTFRLFIVVAAKLNIKVNQWEGDLVEYNIQGESLASVQGTKVKE